MATRPATTLRAPGRLRSTTSDSLFVFRNWKVAAENFVGDLYHVPHMHNFAVKMNFRNQMGDRGYASHAFRQHIWDLGARPAIPPKRNEAPVACPDYIYSNRNLVERLWARLKEWRAVATRYEKTACSFMGVLCMAAAMDWLKG